MICSIIPVVSRQCVTVVVLRFAMCVIVHAQVQVTVELEKDRFLPREKLSVRVKVLNFSGQTLIFGEDNE